MIGFKNSVNLDVGGAIHRVVPVPIHIYVVAGPVANMSIVSGWDQIQSVTPSVGISGVCPTKAFTRFVITLKLVSVL
jgi:hypothetical protein